jgi:hypothetical protein
LDIKSDSFNIIIIIMAKRARLNPQPSLEDTARSDPIFTSLDFVTIFFLQSKVVSLASNPQPGGPGLCIYAPSDREAQIYPKCTRFSFIAFYDSQGYGGGI